MRAAVRCTKVLDPGGLGHPAGWHERAAQPPRSQGRARARSARTAAMRASVAGSLCGPIMLLVMCSTRMLCAPASRSFSQSRSSSRWPCRPSYSSEPGEVAVGVEAQPVHDVVGLPPEEQPERAEALVEAALARALEDEAAGGVQRPAATRRRKAGEVLRGGEQPVDAQAIGPARPVDERLEALVGEPLALQQHAELQPHARDAAEDARSVAVRHVEAPGSEVDARETPAARNGDLRGTAAAGALDAVRGEQVLADQRGPWPGAPDRRQPGLPLRRPLTRQPQDASLTVSRRPEAIQPLTVPCGTRSRSCARRTRPS